MHQTWPPFIEMYFYRSSKDCEIHIVNDSYIRNDSRKNILAKRQVLKKASGNKMYQLRKSMGMSQQKLSQLSGISREQLSRIERQKRTLSPKIAVILAEIFQVSEAELL
jgi:DNA-binding XRE family transcriptional regulator